MPEGEGTMKIEQESEPTQAEIAASLGLSSDASWEDIGRALYEAKGKDYDMDRKRAA